MKIKEVHIIQMCFYKGDAQIEAYTLADFFSFTNKIDIWL